MYLRRIQIENIRGFRSGSQSVDLDLQRPDGRCAGWTVLAGRNGAGKTTLLKAIALAVIGPHAMWALQRSFKSWVREGETAARVAAELTLGSPDSFEGQPGLPAELFPAELKWTRFKAEPEPIPFAPLTPPRGPWVPNPKGWFIAGYGPYRRLMGHSLDAQELMSGPPQFSRLGSLFREDVSLVESIQWLRELHLRRLEKREGAEDLLESILKLLNDGLLPDSTQVVDVDSEGLWVEQRAVKLPLAEMSDGYRTTAALVMDLARQLHLEHQELKLVQQNGSWCVPYPGVVLIDEVELHLHVSWQQRIGFWLKEHFPNIQFIVTTHSPFVCQAADPRGLIRLPAPGEDRTAAHVSDELYRTVVNGTVDEAVLTELFGLEHVHSNQSEELRKRVADLEVRVLDGKASAEEHVELERLAAQLPSTGSALVDRAVRKFRLDE